MLLSNQIGTAQSILSAHGVFVHVMKATAKLCLFNRCDLEPRSWVMQVQLEYPVMVWPHVYELPEPNIGKRKGKVPPAFGMWQVWCSLLTHSGKCFIIINSAMFFVKRLDAVLAEEGAGHRLLTFFVVLNTFNSIPPKAEHNREGRERSQQVFRSQSSAGGYMVLSPGMTNFHFYTCGTVFRDHSLEVLGMRVSRSLFVIPS